MTHSFRASNCSSVIHLDPTVSEEEAQTAFEEIGQVLTIGFFKGNWTAVVYTKSGDDDNEMSVELRRVRLENTL